jgi:hypothetical protein
MGNHLFFECDFFSNIWSGFLKWLNISCHLLSKPFVHALRPLGSYLLHKEISHCLQFIWLVCSLIYLERKNYRIYGEKILSRMQDAVDRQNKIYCLVVAKHQEGGFYF